MLKKILFAPLFLIVFILFTITLVGFSLKLTVLNPEVVKEEIGKTGIYQKIYDNPAEAFGSLSGDKASLEEASKSEEGGSPFTMEETVSMLQGSTTPEQLKEKVDIAIDGFIPYLKGAVNDLDVSIPIGDIKDSFAGQFVDKQWQKYQDLPACKSEADFNTEDIRCLPVGWQMEDVAKAVVPESNGDVISFFSESMGIDQDLNPKKMAEANPDIREGLERLEVGRNAFMNIQRALYLLPLLILAILVFLSLIYTKGFRKIPEVTGWFLIAYGTVFAINGFATSKIGLAYGLNFLGSRLATDSFVIKEVVTPLMQGLPVRFFDTFTYLSLGVVISGILIVVGARLVLHSMKSKDEPRVVEKSAVK